MSENTPDQLANVPLPAGAVKVYDWDDIEFNDPHRYFTGTRRVVERDTDEDISVLVDGTQRPDGRIVRVITVVDGDREIIPSITPGLARQIGAALIAAADEVESAIEIEWHQS
jgi:hypothetical protein